MRAYPADPTRVSTLARRIITPTGKSESVDRPGRRMFWGVEDYSNRSRASDHFGEECTQDLSWREMEASSGIRRFLLGTGTDTIAFQSDKHPNFGEALRTFGLSHPQSILRKRRLPSHNSVTNGTTF